MMQSTFDDAPLIMRNKTVSQQLNVLETMFDEALAGRFALDARQRADLAAYLVLAQEGREIAASLRSAVHRAVRSYEQHLTAGGL